MTESESNESNADDKPIEPAAAPEPWTAERVSEWNSYYDVYVVLGVLLLAFVTSANKITHSSIWTHLKAGEISAAKSAPMLRDQFSYTESGHRWVNIPWVFEWGSALLYKGAGGLVPRDPTDPTASVPRAEQVGAGVLVALNALARVLTVLLLIKIRRPGPGLWWSALCATIAFGVVVNPVGVMLGGLAGPAAVLPETWGTLLLAFELYILHRAINLGRQHAIYVLVPTFLLWANIDDSFIYGLIVLGVVVIGRLVAGAQHPDPLPRLKAIAMWALCTAVCLANPSFYRIYPAAFGPILHAFVPSGQLLTQDQLSYFGKELWATKGEATTKIAQFFILYYFFFVGLGFASFVLNRRHFSPGRFLMFAIAAVLWGLLIRFGIEFAVIFTATLSLNGQEWYHDRFGTQGRLGGGWTFWSTGGRFVTLLLVFACVAVCLTGYGRPWGDQAFGFGFDPDNFAFEAAEYLRTEKVQGNVLNTSLLQGDSLIWKAYPARKTFLDSRRHLFPPSLPAELQKARLALSEDAIETWKPILDKHGVTAVMIHEPESRKTYRRLMRSLNWIPFYDDGTVVMFGRADAPAGDVAVFKANRLDESLAYRGRKPVPPTDRTPTPLTWVDTIFVDRFLRPPQPHTDSSARWLEGLDPDAGNFAPPTPARCLLAIREARAALAKKPDDTRAYRLLSTAYRELMTQETGLLAGLTFTPENRARMNNIPLQPALLMNRFRQRATSLNFAIQTSPPPRDRTTRLELHQLNLELFYLYASVEFYDLARERLNASLVVVKPDDIDGEIRTRLSRDLSQLDEKVKQIEDQVSNLVAERQAGPYEQADYALRLGAPGLAIQQLEEALQVNVSPMDVTPKLLDLYCDTGQPDKALDLLSKSTNIDDPTFGREPGTSALRQGRVFYLIGNYEYAATLWKRNAIPALRQERSARALNAGRALVHGEAKVGVSTFESIPGKITMQAAWEHDLGFCLLEGGEPALAATELLEALSLEPNLPTRPVIAYYLEKLGKTVPPLPKTGEPGESTAEATPATKTETSPTEKTTTEAPPNAVETPPKEKPAETKAEEKPKAEEPPSGEKK